MTTLEQYRNLDIDMIVESHGRVYTTNSEVPRVAPLVIRKTPHEVIESKVNFLAPAAGEAFIARGKVMRSGRSISVCTGEVTAVAQGSEKLVALMQATMMAVAGQESIRD